MAELGITCWVLSDGRRGMENQCLGIAEAIAERVENTEILKKVIHPRAPWKWFPESLFGRPWPLPFVALGSDSDTLTPPWPDVLIACGRLTVAYSAAISKRSRGRTFVVQTQDPRLSPRYFDLVVPPAHDNLSGDTVYSILGSPNRINDTTLRDGALSFSSLYEDLPRPLAAVLIGGDSKHYKLSPRRAEAIADDLAGLAARGIGLAITTSRRTSREAEALLRARLNGSGVHFWDGAGENPYFGMLGLADHIIVTEESTNMVTEAAATGKPVHVLSLEGGAPKFEAFHRQMQDAGITRPFSPTLESWTYEPLRETAKVAGEILNRLGRI